MVGSGFHEPVMVKEVLEILSPRPGEICVDMTLGGGGHAEAILQELGESGRLIGIDRDEAALEAARKTLRRFGSRATLVHDNFVNLDGVLMDMGVTPNVLLFDLGLSSHQLERPERGFSFSKPGPLDMRMDRNQTETAWSLLERLPVRDIARLIRDFGEEPRAEKIARRIVKMRERGRTPPTTIELGEAVESVTTRSGRRRLHPATKTFMALRIAVNNELENLDQALEKALKVLAPGGRIGVISYHSLEDRIVKRFFAEKAKGCTCPPSAPVCACGKKPELRVITKKPIRPSGREIERNPRSRSARLRVAEKIEEQ